MSKVTEAFSNSKAFIPFLTAGDPNIEKTENYILELEKAGADLIEIGIPFSDPIAEGVVIQEADLRSLKARYGSFRAQKNRHSAGVYDLLKPGVPLRIRAVLYKM